MKAFYIETNAYNAILVVSDGRFISYDDVIDGIDINRENISEIAKRFEEHGFNSSDFNAIYALSESGNIVKEEYKDLDELLDGTEYSEEIYSAE